MVNGALHIEGERSRVNGDLKEGFRVLLNQKLNGKSFRIYMGRGKEQTVEQFCSNHNGNKYLLVDLDKEEEHREREINSLGLKEYKLRTHFMIQEMEAWFISQAENVLDKYYGIEISKKIPAKHAMKFEKPDEQIQEWLRPSKKDYHKVRDGVELLKKLNLEQLMNDFPDVKNLVTELSKS
jgi:hypothetical protein